MLDHYDKSVPSQQHARNLEDLVYATWSKREPLANNARALEQLGNRIASHLIMEPHGEAFSINNALPTIKPEQVETAILTYLDEAPKALLQTPWSTSASGLSEHPVMRGIVAIIGAISKDPLTSTTMQSLLLSGRWNPDPLWHALAETLEPQSKMLGANTRWELYPFWQFTKIMSTYAIATEWMPTKNGVSENMWHAAPFLKYDMATSVETMAKKTPWAAGQALEYYQFQDLEGPLATSVATAIMGMDFAAADAKYCLKTLLELAHDNGIDQSYAEGLQCFREKYPSLATSIFLQASFMESVSDTPGCVDALLASWSHEINGKAIEQMALPDLSFESP